jgi:glycerol transport system ATP-binding protein
MNLTLDNVSKSVGAAAYVSNVSMTLASGSLNVLLGATLSGKTTLMRLMAGLDAPTSGRILFNGKDVTGVDVRRRNVAMVYQQFINYPAMTVYENIASPLRVRGLASADIDKQVREAARLLRLEPMLERLPLQLSGGQQQRTAIARALVKGADLVLMDEPLANLDYKLREELREELPRIFEATGAIFVYATTEPTEALMLGGSTATLWQGRVTQFGRTSEVYRAPADVQSAGVFSDPPLNTCTAQISNGATRIDNADAGAGLFPALDDGAYTLGFRAHQLYLERPPAHALSFPATVRVVEITGSESFVHVEAAGHRWVALAPGVRRFEPGAKIDVHLDARELFAFAADGRTAYAPQHLMKA